MNEFEVTYKAVGTRTGEKVHTLTIINGTGTNRTDCGARASGMHQVTLNVVRDAHEHGRLCKLCVPGPERFLPVLAKQEAV